jgi:hypothetical protein
MATTSTIAPSEAVPLTELIVPTPHGIASRIDAQEPARMILTMLREPKAP